MGQHRGRTASDSVKSTAAATERIASGAHGCFRSPRVRLCACVCVSDTLCPQCPGQLTILLPPTFYLYFVAKACCVHRRRRKFRALAEEENVRLAPQGLYWDATPNRARANMVLCYNREVRVMWEAQHPERRPVSREPLLPVFYSRATTAALLAATQARWVASRQAQVAALGLAPVGLPFMFAPRAQLEPLGPSGTVYVGPAPSAPPEERMEGQAEGQASPPGGAPAEGYPGSPAFCSACGKRRAASDGAFCTHF